jgi:hypothetical protein
MAIAPCGNLASHIGGAVGEQLRHLDGITAGSGNLSARLGEVGKRGLHIGKGGKKFIGGRGAKRCQGLLHRCAILRAVRSAGLPRSGNLFAERLGLIGQ